MRTIKKLRPCDWCSRPIYPFWIDLTGAWEKCVPKEKQKDYICYSCFRKVPDVLEHVAGRVKKITRKQLKELGGL